MVNRLLIGVLAYSASDACAVAVGTIGKHMAVASYFMHEDYTQVQ